VKNHRNRNGTCGLGKRGLHSAVWALENTGSSAPGKAGQQHVQSWTVISEQDILATVLIPLAKRKRHVPILPD